MKAETLKASLTYALNFNMADYLIDSICRIIEATDNPGELMKELTTALVMLRVDVGKIIRSYEQNQKALADYYRESLQQALEDKVMEAMENRENIVTHIEDPELEREAA